MTQSELIAAVHLAAMSHDIDPKLFEALCRVESGLDPYAIRYEPAYSYLFNPKTFAKNLRITLDTESALQRFSAGPCQIMLAVVREQGYIGHLSAIIGNSEYLLQCGARHLKGFLRRYPRVEDAIASWNAGSVRRMPNGSYVNQAYVEKVLRELRKLKTLP